MLHPKLRLTAAEFALDLASVDDLVVASHAALNDAVYADGLAVIATTKNLSQWEANQRFASALRELGHAFTSQDEALRHLRLSYFAPIAEGWETSSRRLRQQYYSFHREVRLGRSPLSELDAWDDPSAQALMDHCYDREHLLAEAEREMDPLAPGEALFDWHHKAVQLCRDWCREYARLYLQPAWRSPTVLALATGIHADRAFDRLPVLADALEEAGCDHADILAHCRQNSPHFEYCWVVDLLLGKS